MGSIRWTKIKNIKHEKIELGYQEKGINGDYDTITMECMEEARPQFYHILKELVPFVVELCELPADYEDRISVSGVAFSYGGDAEIMGATIMGKMKLLKSKGVIALNTPYKAEKRNSVIPDVTGKGSELLPQKCIELINRLKAEARSYMKGERLQAKLELKDGKAAAAGEKKEKEKES